MRRTKFVIVGLGLAVIKTNVTLVLDSWLIDSAWTCFTMLHSVGHVHCATCLVVFHRFLCFIMLSQIPILWLTSLVDSL